MQILDLPIWWSAKKFLFSASQNTFLFDDNRNKNHDKVYEELVSVRQTVTQEQEQKVQAEIDLLKQKTGTEIEHLRLTAQQVGTF